MDKQEFGNASYEVLKILEYIKDDDLKRIPQEEIENARKMIFDSDFILYLKEENKEQPYFALKVDNTDVLVPNNLD